MDNEKKRLSRLAAILTQLQSRRLITASSLAAKHKVSIRTIYRDIKALEESGVPVLTEEGKGYSIMEGYHIPPVMFTEREAFALITIEQIILKHKDASLVKEFTEAITKIKSVLRDYSKDKVELLEQRMFIGKNFEKKTTSQSLIDIQFAIVGYQLIKIVYETAGNPASERLVEPFLLYHNQEENWMLVAYCRLRKDFRTFRLDRMKKIQVLDETFPPHNLTIQQYCKKYLKISDNP